MEYNLVRRNLENLNYIAYCRTGKLGNLCTNGLKSSSEKECKIVSRRDNMGKEEDDKDSFTVLSPININKVSFSSVLKLMKNEVGSSSLHEFLCYVPKKEDTDVVEGMVRTVARFFNCKLLKGNLGASGRKTLTLYTTKILNCPPNN